MDEHPLQGLALIVVLVLFQALLSSFEAVMQNITEGNVRKKAEEGDRKSEKLLWIFKSQSNYINVIELLLLTINFFVGFIFANSHYKLIHSFIHENILKSNNDSLAKALTVISIIICIYVIVVFGTLLPKKIAIKHAESFLYRFGSIIRLFTYVLMPLLWLMEKNTNILLRVVGIRPEELEDNVTEEEIISILNEGQEKGVFEADEAEMISNIIEFDEKEAKDIMTHRKKIVAIDVETKVEDTLKFMLNENYSRFPIYQNDIDDIVGVLHMKDVIICYMNNELDKKTIRDIAGEAYFVPDTQNIDSLLHDMQVKKVHMAIAIDEYGQTAGVVTMEDILEEIVGDIQDEYDNEEELISVQDDNSYIVMGNAPLDEVAETIGIKISDEDLEIYDTLSGFLISKLDRIPGDGETETIEYMNFNFEILDTKNKMIHMVHIYKNDENNEDESKEDNKTLSDEQEISEDEDSTD